MPRSAYHNPLAFGGSDADLVTWALNFVFVDGKMRGFFSLLFGASMLLVIQRAEAAGASPASVHYRRMFWLLVFGLIHMWLIWWGDILTVYAIVGMVAFAFRDKPVRSLVKWAIGLLILQVTLLASLSNLFFAVEAAAMAPGASAVAVEKWQMMSVDFLPLSGAALSADLAIHHGSYGGILEHRLNKMLLAPLIEPLVVGWETLAYMLLGMAGLKSGFLTGAWERRRYGLIAASTLAVAIPAYALLAWLNYRAGFHIPTLFAVSLAATTPFRPLMIFGYAALTLLLMHGGGRLTGRIAAAGRAAFTNYLGTSLVMTTLFYGYGFGLYGAMNRAELWLVVVATGGVMLLWSKAWLDRFQYGPFEWLWRSLSRFELQPMRRRPAAAG
jgi:uncharacterized protein